MALVADAATTSSTLGAEAPITLLVVGTEEDGAGELYARLATIAERYGEMVELRQVDPEELPAPYEREALLGPTVLVLRRGELVGEAMGSCLPARELDRVVRCAVEWPDALS